MGAPELAVVAESFGRALTLEPYFATVVLGAQLVALAGTAQQRAAILPHVADGTMKLAFGYDQQLPTENVTEAVPSAAGGWLLTGQKQLVLGGDSAEVLVVTARTEAAELGLFTVRAADLRRDCYQTFDGLGAADLLLADSPGELLGTFRGTAGYIDEVIDRATAYLCAEAVGVLERAFSLSAEYLKLRKQFGVALSSMQVLRHRLADMYISLEGARSMALLATLATDSEDPAERTRLVAAAKILVNQSARDIGQQALQLFGGIGMTMEHPIAHYVRRASVLARTMSNSDHLLRSLGATGGLFGLDRVGADRS